MMIFVPGKIDLSGLPLWFVYCYVAVYGVLFVAMLVLFGYMTWLMFK